MRSILIIGFLLFVSQNISAQISEADENSKNELLNKWKDVQNIDFQNQEKFQKKLQNICEQKTIFLETLSNKGYAKKDIETVEKALQTIVCDAASTQENAHNQIIEYDFEKKQFTKRQQKLKQNKPIVFRLININPLVHRVDFESEDFKIRDPYLDDAVESTPNSDSDSKKVDNTAKSEVEKQMNLVIDKVTQSVIQKSDKLVNSKKSTETTDNLQKIRDELAAKEKLFIEKESLLIAERSKTDTAQIDGFWQESEAEKKLYSEAKQLRYEIYAIEKKLSNEEAKANQIQDLVKTIKKNILEVRTKNNTLKKEISELKVLNDYYTNYRKLTQVSTLNHKEYIDYRTQKSLTNESKRTELYQNIRSIEWLVNSGIESDINLLNYQIDLLPEEQNTLKDEIKLIVSTVQSERANLVTDFQTHNFRSKLDDVEFLDKKLSEEKTYTFSSPPLQGYEDKIIFHVKVYEKQGNSENKTLDFTYSDYLKGGIRWDFSVGTVFDFGLNEEKFDFKTNPSDTLKVIVANNKDDFNPNLAGIFHTSFRNTRLGSFAFSLGASVNVSEFKLNSLFPGISLMLGKTEKFVITVGPSFRQVKQLKSSYNNGDTINASLNEDDITRETYKIGYFFGLSYNLTQSQKAKFKIN